MEEPDLAPPGTASAAVLSLFRMQQEVKGGLLPICAITITVIAVVFFLLNLAGVLVPLTFAVFLTFLVEPILATIVLTPHACVRFSRQIRRRLRRPVTAADLEASDPLRGTAGRRHTAASPASATVEASVALNAEVGPAMDSVSSDGSGWVGAFLLVWLQRAWDAVSIILCVIVLLGIVGSVGLLVYAAFDQFDWSKYKNSHKLQDILDFLKDKMGITLSSLEDGSFLKDFKLDAVSLALEVINITESVILTMLMFLFCLVATLPGIHARAHHSRVKNLMQRYLLCKTVSSLIIALAVMLALHLMHVDLVVVFGVITFALNFIPNVGSFLAMIAPVPLVYLDPKTGLNDVIFVVLVPFIIHNSLGCIIEPKLMADGLDLHPLTVIVALTFWGSVWGICGAVLSVPLTCALRLALEEVDHPYAKALYGVFDVPFGTRTAKAAGSVGASGASGPAADVARSVASAMHLGPSALQSVDSMLSEVARTRSVPAVRVAVTATTTEMA